MKSEQQEATCTICQTKTVGNFCHTCGQEDTKKRLSFITLIKDIFSNILNLEKSGFSTMVHLLRTPKKIIENYWNGKRRYYQPPSRLVVYASVVLGLHSLWHGNLIIGLAFGDHPQLGFLTIFLILFPLSSFIAYYKRKKNLVEHLVANFYLFSTWSIIIVLWYDLCFLVLGKNMNLSWTSLALLVILMLGYDAKVFAPQKELKFKLLYACFQFLLLVLILLVLIGFTVLTGQAEINF